MNIPDIKPKNRLVSPLAGTYKLYGWDRSYFTRKLEAALIFYRADYQLVRKTNENTALLERRADTHQIPVLHTSDNWMIADTTPVMHMLDHRFPFRTMFPKGSMGVLVQIIEEYFDEWVPRTAVHWRWNYPENHELLSIDAAGGDEEYAKKLIDWGLKACRATGVTSVTQQAQAEQEYLRVLDASEKQLSQTAYLLGDRPTAVDCIVLGGLRAHFNYDPAPKKAIQNYSKTIRWCEKLADQWDGRGNLVELPALTGFARFILDEMNATYSLYALANKAALAAGEKAFKINVYGEDVSYLARSYIEKSRQMIADRIANELSKVQRQELMAVLETASLEQTFTV